MAGHIPRPTVPSGAKIKRTTTDPPKVPWRFSFRFLRQLPPYFCYADDAGWFISLIERLGDLSREPIDRVFSDKVWGDGIRYHDIDWSLKNVPITIHDLSWVPGEYLRNQEEFPVVQFHVSKALGRVVGFFDEEWVFNVVLLDKLHNIQPSKRNDYQVTSMSPGKCLFTALVGSLQELTAGGCCNAGCPYPERIKAVMDGHVSKNILLINLDQSECEYLGEVIKKKTHGDSAKEILLNALVK